MNILATALLALTTFGTAAVAADCTDLAGQGTLCQTVSADPASGVDVDVVVTLDPQPPVGLAAVSAPVCQDLAGQGFACADVVADPATGVDADVIVVVQPTPPLAA